MTPFALATIYVGSDLQTAIVLNDVLFPLNRAGVPAVEGKSIRVLLEDWTTNFPLLENIAARIASGTLKIKPFDKDAIITHPVHYPDKLLVVGANYSSHLQEMGLPVEKWNPMPIFTCPPKTCLVGPGKTLRYPPSTKQFDWECELTAVIGAPLSKATSTSQAAAAIAGYLIVLDMSCRDLLIGAKGMLDIMRGKAQDTMKPAGPYFVPKEFVGAGVNNLRIQLWVDGEKMTDGNTSEMLFNVDECVEEMSKVTSLVPGDMVVTGTPAGGAKSNGGKWLKVGDNIEASIGELGVLKVEVVE